MTAHSPSMPARLGVLMPMYNERACIARTLTELAAALRATGALASLTVILVDDASTDDGATVAAEAWRTTPRAWESQDLHLLRLSCNAGHQKAIHAGLRHAADLGLTHLAVMDADGQDDPHALAPMLAEAQAGADVVFAKRTKRRESLLWRGLYQAFQLLFRLALGQTLFIGNYCVVGARVLPWLASRRDVQHLGATLAMSRFRKAFVGVARRSRSDGESKMSYWALIDYGIAAMTVSPEAWVRFFSRLALGVFAVALAGIATVVGIKLFTSYAIPGWASLVSLSVFGIGLQAVVAIIVTAFLGRLLQNLAPAQADVDTAVAIVTAGGDGMGTAWRRSS